MRPPVHTEPDNAQRQHREHADIQEGINHTSLPPKRISVADKDIDL
jgi:hypothetical protein